MFDNFFDDKDFDSSNFDECSYNEQLSMEYDSFGFYLSDHPSKFYKSLSYENDLYDIAKLNEYEADPLNENKFFKCICLVSELKERKNLKLVRDFVFLVCLMKLEFWILFVFLRY